MEIGSTWPAALAVPVLRGGGGRPGAGTALLGDEVGPWTALRAGVCQRASTSESTGDEQHSHSPVNTTSRWYENGRGHRLTWWHVLEAPDPDSWSHLCLSYARYVLHLWLHSWFVPDTLQL